MPLKTAQRLCPHAVYLPGKYARYKEASKQFHEVQGAYTPWIEPLGTDEAYLDMTEFESLYGPPVAIAKSSIGSPENKTKRTMTRSAPRTWAIPAKTVLATK